MLILRDALGVKYRKKKKKKKVSIKREINKYNEMLTTVSKWQYTGVHCPILSISLYVWTSLIKAGRCGRIQSFKEKKGD